MIHKRQSPIHYGFTDMNGKQWCNQHIDTYNEFTRLVNQSADRQIEPESLTAGERNFYLDQRHKFYCAVSGIQGF